MKWLETEFLYGRWLASGIAVLVLFACTVLDAQAQVASNAALIKWVNATEFVTPPGGLLPVTGPQSIVQTRVVRGSCNADGSFNAVLETLNVPVTATSVLFENLPDGTFCYRARHIQENGDQSAWSVTRSKASTQPPLPKSKPPSITIS